MSKDRSVGPPLVAFTVVCWGLALALMLGGWGEEKAIECDCCAGAATIENTKGDSDE